MAILAVQTVVRGGIDPVYEACDVGGDEFINTGIPFIHIKNGDASPVDVTIETPNAVDGLAVADRVVTVPATSERMLGPFPARTYNDANAKVKLTYDSVTSLTIGLFKSV
jgi:hypothetical protein